MTAHKGFIVGAVTAVSAGILIGSLAARKRGNGIQVSMGLARQPKPEGRKVTLGERFTHNAEMPAVGEWKE
jgi:hypothetical protein